MMRCAVSGYGLTATASAATSASASANEPKVSRNNIQVEYIRIDSYKPYCEARAALEKLPRFDDRIRALLNYGEIARVEAELERIQGDAGVVIFSVATHGDWLQILSGKRCRQGTCVAGGDTLGLGIAYAGQQRHYGGIARP